MAGLDLNGNLLWLSSVGGSADAYEDLGYESGNAICGQSGGLVYATGSTLSGAQFGSTYLPAWSRKDMFVAKLIVPPAQEPGTLSGFSALIVEDSASVAQSEKKTFPANENNLPLIYPNPNQGIFSIRIDGFAEEATEVIVMKIGRAHV